MSGSSRLPWLLVRLVAVIVGCGLVGWAVIPSLKGVLLGVVGGLVLIVVAAITVAWEHEHVR